MESDRVDSIPNSALKNATLSRQICRHTGKRWTACAVSDSRTWSSESVGWRPAGERRGQHGNTPDSHGDSRPSGGHTDPEGDTHAVSKPQPKADKGARCRMYVLASGNVVNRKGFGLKITASSFSSSSITNCAVTWARVHWSSTGLLRPPLADF